MVYIKYILLALLATFLVVISVEFVLENTQPITIQFFNRVSPSYSVGFWLVVTLIIGALFGFLLNLWAILSIKFKQLRLYRDLHECEKELIKLKTKTESSVEKLL